MKITPRVSVIMPVYNPGLRLKEAIGSVETQIFRDWELILVDDGATDGSAAVCDEAAARDNRIRVLHQPNVGICAARNAGLALAGGKYLAFCDDDDRYLPSFLGNAYALAEEHQADVVRFNYTIERELSDGDCRLLPHKTGQACVLHRPDGGMAYDAFLRGSGPLFVWNALYRRTAVGNLQFDCICRYGLEDFVFNAALYADVKTMAYSPEVAYFHREHGGSTSVNCTPETLQWRFAALKPWMDAEYRAAKSWCRPKELTLVWNERKAGAITFVMHQLRDADADRTTEKEAWRALRKILETGGKNGKFDFLRVAGQNRKQGAALLLYQMHLTGLYRLLTKKEDAL